MLYTVGCRATLQVMLLIVMHIIYNVPILNKIELLSSNDLIRVQHNWRLPY